MEEVILFLLCFILVLTFYEIIFVEPLKKSKKKNELLEVRYLIIKYHLDRENVNYNQLLQICALTSSLDISLAVSLVSMVNGLILELVVGFVSVVLLIFISYYFVYLFYKKKGMILDGKHK